MPTLKLFFQKIRTPTKIENLKISYNLAQLDPRVHDFGIDQHPPPPPPPQPQVDLLTTMLQDPIS